LSYFPPPELLPIVLFRTLIIEIRSKKKKHKTTKIQNNVETT